jgi:signal transduction histidine kinase
VRKWDLPLENVAEIGWGALLIIYLVGSGRPELLRTAVLAVFGLSAAAALLELYLHHRRWRWLALYDALVWTLCLSGMVAVTGGRGSEVWPAYLMMSLTAPTLGRRSWLYGLLALNSLIYASIYAWINPFGTPFTPALLLMRTGLIFLIAWVMERSMERETAANRKAIATARSRVAELVSARDAERKRIAGDIHDWLGSGIVAPMRQLELALRAPDPAAAAKRSEGALAVLRRSHEELRRLMENLHPHLLEQMGLTGALRAYLQQWGDENGTATAFRGDEGPEPPPEVALACYRILQEALNNAARHAGAASVSVQLALRAGAVTLTVQDDGSGFTAPAGPGSAPAGRGLPGMAERAAVFGGTVAVDSRPGRGTTVTARLPVPDSIITG